jgi:RNA-directed DNA polymerase
MNRPTEEPTCRMKVSEIQRKLAEKATHQPEHRFTNLYDLLTWQPLMEWAFDTLMTNQGSRTAGIDGMDKRTAIAHKDLILTELRAALKSNLYEPQPVRRVYIPKPNGKQRPLGIATLIDRLVQMMMKAILEPIYESDFLPCSHGFRPRRSGHTAMAYLHLRTAPRVLKMYWAIEGDITGCFDHVQHRILVRLLKRRIQDEKLLAVIWKMLKAGVMEGTLFIKTDEGTPQGAIVSPLLANVYLRELDVWMEQHYTGLSTNEKSKRRYHKEGNAFYVRYADDFVVAWNGTKEGAEKLKTELGTFLRDELGLELSDEKTRITHVMEGYDFLGFTVKRVIDQQRGYDELLFYPSTKSVMKIKAKIKAMTKRGTTLASVRDKIEAMNLLLRGWANYFCHSAASRTLQYIGSYAFRRMEKWLMSKTGLRVRAVYKKYYRRHHGYLTWVVGDTVLYHPGISTRITYVRYVHRPNPYLDTTKTIELAHPLSPYPGKREWSGFHYYGETWTEIREEVLKQDGNRCRLCDSQERVEVHHIKKHKSGKPHRLENLVTLCAACHRKIRNPQSEESRRLAGMTP